MAATMMNGYRCLFLSLMLAAGGVTFPARADGLWRDFTTADGLPENACDAVTVNSGGDVVVSAAHTNVLSLLDGYAISQVPAPPGEPRHVYESPGGQLWAVGAGGLLSWHDDKWTSYAVPALAGHGDGNRTNDVPLLPVRQDRVLVLLADQLLQCDTEDPQRVEVHVLLTAAATSLGSFATMVAAPDGRLWIAGTRGAIHSSSSLRNLKSDTQWTFTFALPEELENRRPGRLAAALVASWQVLDSAVGADNSWWLATTTGLRCEKTPLWKIQPPEKPLPEFTDSLPDPLMLENAAIPAPPEELGSPIRWSALLAARNGDVWIARGSVMAWWHRNAWRLFAATNQTQPDNVIAFAEAPDGRVWSATPGTIWEFDRNNWTVLRSGFEQINGLCGARDGTLWVATDRGVLRLSHGIWIANGMEEGLPTAVVQRVAEDQLGRIWALTPAGPCIYDPDADVDPPKTFILPLATEADSFREDVPVSLFFRGMDKWKLTTPDRLLFSYRLDEREWSPFQRAREVILTELPAGRHYFQVRALDRNGNVDPVPARLEFLVALPWYKETRIVIIMALALVVALALTGLASNRHRRLKQSYAVVAQQIAARTRELEMANQELLHSQKMNALGTLASGIAHDFNNILSIIKGSAQIMEENLDNPEKLRTRLDRIKTMISQGAGIVNAMLGFSGSTGEQPLPGDLNAVVGDTVRLLGDRFLHEVEINFEPAPGLAEFPIVRNLVQQILLNFIFNAAEATTPPKQVWLSIRKLNHLPETLVLKPGAAPAYAAVSVRDNGCGIAPENLPRIFEPFFTTKALSTRRGTGLGLSMVYELAKKMEAGLAVRSVAGRGSTFTLILPVRQDSKNAKLSPS